MAVFALLQDWDQNGEETPIESDLVSVERTIRGLSGRESADLFLLKDGRDVTETDRWLSVSTSRGRYAVHAQIREGRPATFMGDPDAEGKVPFAHGGSMSLYQTRFCTDVDEAVSLARTFIETDGEFAEPARWWLEPFHDQPAF
jgi:hypothetical protein